MKAAQIMLFLLIFLLSVELISASNIYVMGTSSSDFETQTEEVDDPYSISSEEGLNVGKVMGRIFVLASTGIVVGAIFGAAAHYVSGVPGDRAFVYGLFAGAFWGMTIDACYIFNSIAPFNPGIVMVVSIFLVVCGAVFLIGFKQLVTGGWQAFM